MTKRADKTSLGGDNECFLTTQWSVIFNAKTTDEVRHKLIMDRLLREYWKPVYCSIRRHGYDNEQAKDLTQGFFEEVVLTGNLVKKADRKKGRFRTFLLTALDHYLIDVLRKENAKKRSPRGRKYMLDTSAIDALPAVSPGMNPEQVFNYVWATEILDRVITLVERECCSTDKQIHWRVFHAKILLPIIQGTDEPSLRELCDQYEIKDESRASNMIITVKRCFKRILEAQLQRYVRTDVEVEGEVRELFEIIAEGGAGSK